MTTKPDNNSSGQAQQPYEVLERIFHEPSRLAIMSALCTAREGLTFNELKETCRLTDGNLNRHLKVLEEAAAVRIVKTFVGLKPRTTIYLSRKGLDRFTEYLDALAEVLNQARKAVPEGKPSPALFGRTVPV
jgi:DNA-binding transcriptional ArsR family regulator